MKVLVDCLQLMDILQIQREGIGTNDLYVVFTNLYVFKHTEHILTWTHYNMDGAREIPLLNLFMYFSLILDHYSKIY